MSLVISPIFRRQNFARIQKFLTYLLRWLHRVKSPTAASITSLHLTPSKASRCQSAAPKTKASLLTPSIHLIRGLQRGRDVLMFSWNTSDMVRSRGALTTCPAHCNLLALIKLVMSGCLVICEFLYFLVIL